MGPQVQVTNIERKHCKDRCWNVPENCGSTVGVNLVGFDLVGFSLVGFGLVSLLGSIASAWSALAASASTKTV